MDENVEVEKQSLTPEQVTRIERAIAFFDKLAPNHFDLREIVTGESDADIAILKEVAKEPSKTFECGTSACFMGFAPAIYPEDFHWGFSRYGDIDVFFNKEDDEKVLIEEFAEYLGLPDDEFFYENKEGGEKTMPQEMAAKLREFLKANT